MKTNKYFLLLSVALMLAACGQDVELGLTMDDMSPEVVVKSANTSEDASNMRVGEYRTLTVDFNIPLQDDVKWTTSSDCVTLEPEEIGESTNNTIRYYAKNCRVIAVSQGTAWITARVGDYETKFKIDVTAPVVADFTVDTSNYLEVGFEITADSKTYDSFKWDFGDGGTHTTWTSLFHYYSVGGTYVVSLTLTSNKYGSDTKYKTITVKEPTGVPYASFSYSIYGYMVYLTNKSKGATSYYWSFGDGTASYNHSPVHEYSSPGYYTVTLTAYNKYGSSSASARFYVPD